MYVAGKGVVEVSMQKYTLLDAIKAANYGSMSINEARDSLLDPTDIIDLNLNRQLTEKQIQALNEKLDRKIAEQLEKAQARIEPYSEEQVCFHENDSSKVEMQHLEEYIALLTKQREDLIKANEKIQVQAKVDSSGIEVEETVTTRKMKL